VPATRKKSFLASPEPAEAKKSFLASPESAEAKKKFFSVVRTRWSEKKFFLASPQYCEKQSKTTTTQIDNENFIFLYNNNFLI
jgi:hypothetical protein